MPLRYWCVFALVLAASGQNAKQYRDRVEYDLHLHVTKDFAARDFTKALAGLDSWAAKYAQSAFHMDRQLLYVQAYLAAGQPGRALEAGAPLLAAELTPADRLRLLYTLTTAIRSETEPTAAQRSTGAEAAGQLAAFDKAPEGTPAADWARARADLQTAARTTLLHLALLPAAEALKAQDCPAAEAAAMKAVGAYPESVQAAWYLASAQLCIARAKPEKAPEAIYQFARAAALDPVKGFVDPKWQQSTVAPYLEKIYTQYHGADPESLARLKELAAQSPLPPPGFVLKSAVQIEQDRQADFESRYPEVALWTKIRAALAAPDGQQYFESGVKNAAVPQLTGRLVEAKPVCRPTELRVAVRGETPEILLKLAKPLAGKAEPGTEFRFEGIPTAFTGAPFLLTMQSEEAKLAGLKIQPCQSRAAKQ